MATEQAAETIDTALNQLTERLVVLADKIAENAGPAGEAAWQVTMLALRIEALGNIGVGALLVIIAAIAFKAAGANWKQVGWDTRGYGDLTDSVTSTARLIVSMTFAAVCFGLTISALGHLLHVPTWVTAISPEAGLALRIINGL